MNSLQEDGDVDETTRMVKNVIDGVEEGDLVRFNDRKVPLVVDSVNKNKHKCVEIKGPRGGRYRFSLTSRSETGSFSRATGETGKYGIRLWEKKKLTDVEIVATHRFEFGNVYQKKHNKEEMKKSQLYSIVTDETDEFGNPIVISVHIYNGNVIGIDERDFSKSYIKPKVLDEEGQYEYIGSISKYYYDTERDMAGEIVDFGTREDVETGIYFSFNGNASSGYIPYQQFLPEVTDRLQPVERDDVYN